MVEDGVGGVNGVSGVRGETGVSGERHGEPILLLIIELVEITRAGGPVPGDSFRRFKEAAIST